MHANVICLTMYMHARMHIDHLYPVRSNVLLFQTLLVPFYYAIRPFSRIILAPSPTLLI
jgi:hypothetical protein